MKLSVKISLLVILFALVSVPLAYSRVRVDEPAGAPASGATRASSSGSGTSGSTSPSVVPAQANGQCPAGYRCNQCVKI